LIDLVVKSREIARMKERVFEAFVEFTSGQFDDDVMIVALSAE
jgi:hypothetical protein